MADFTAVSAVHSCHGPSPFPRYRPGGCGDRSVGVGGIHEKSRFINRWLNQPNEGRVCSCVFPGPIGGAWWCWFASLVVFNGTSFFNFFATHTQNRLLSPLLRLHTTPWLSTGSSGTLHASRSFFCSIFVCRNHLIDIIEQLYVFWIG